jgi:UDP-N-acetylmuramate dehydrogenase
LPFLFLGGGTNLIVADEGFPGIVLRLAADRIAADGNSVTAEAGATLDELVDFTVNRALAGLETLAGIPGQVGAALYGNAGAYGHSISERVREVRAFDGQRLRRYSREECGFRYRESVFKQRKDSIIFSATLDMTPGDAGELRHRAEEIRRMRNEKFPPRMQCAGSVFKNLLWERLPPGVRAEVPDGVAREGKVPAAWFLEQAGAKGRRRGAMQVASYHANLIYNTGCGTAADLRALIVELKERVRQKFGLTLEEEVQYVGFRDSTAMALKQLAGTLKVMNALLEGVSEEEAAVKPTPSSFTLAETVAHMVHVERHCYHMRLEALLGEENPAIAAYDPKAHEAAGMYSGKTLEAAMQELAAGREENLAVLRRLAPDQFARTGMHEALGKFTLEEMVNEWAAHDLGHVRQAANILREVRHVPAMGPFSE